MRVVRKSRLRFQEGRSDKVYEVDLCDLGEPAGAARYLVNFRYGRRGQRLREGTKTVSPVAQAEAAEIFDSVVVSKLNRGYLETEGGSGGDGVVPAGGGATAARDDRKALETLLARFDSTGEDDKAITRIVWRLGELRAPEAGARIARLAGRGGAMLDYCVAWALGRCGDPATLGTLQALWTRHASTHVGSMAREAYLEHAGPAAAGPHLESVANGLPEALRDAVVTGNKDDADAALRALLAQSTPQTPELLEALYLLARTRPAARAALIDVLPVLELAPNTFKGLRRVFKHAEYRDDAEIFGILARRFDLTVSSWPGTAGYGRIQLPGSQERVAANQELARADARLACSQATRDYLRRRIWRTLRRLGERGDDAYVEMASGVLLAMSDADAQPERTTERYVYQGGTVQVSSTLFDAWAGFLAFNHVLHGRSPSHRLSALRGIWSRTDAGGAPPGRTEAFPELWDRHPEVLLRLLALSGCEPVHVFATRALAANQSFLASLGVDGIETLLARPYECTCALGLDLARQRIEAGTVDTRLIAALLGAHLAAARELAQKWVNGNLDLARQDASILFALATTAYSGIRDWAVPILAMVRLADAERAAFTARLVAWLLERTDDDDPSRIEALCAFLIDVFGPQLKAISTAVLEDLLAHESTSVRLAAGRLIVARTLDGSDGSMPLLGRLLQDADGRVRAIGVELLATLPDDTLLEHADLVAGLAVADATEVRQAASALVARLTARDPAYGQRLARSLADRLFRAEPSEGFHDDVLAMLGGPLERATHGFDTAFAWRALMARSRGAQAFGALLLERTAPRELSVRQLARLADHPFVAVRRYALSALNDDPERAKASLVDTLGVLDTSWDDTREAAFAWMREAFGAQQWTPELIVGVCDNPREDVQRFGRELITTWFCDEDGPHYVIRLAEHPAPAVQLFVSGMLAQHASGEPERIRALMPYFASVLTRVNAGRAAKRRVTAFLRNEALASEPAAREIAALAARLSSTPMIADKALMVELLRDIGERFPGVEGGLRVIAPRRREPRLGGA